MQAIQLDSQFENKVNSVVNAAKPSLQSSASVKGKLNSANKEAKTKCRQQSRLNNFDFVGVAG